MPGTELLDGPVTVMVVELMVDESIGSLKVAEITFVRQTPVAVSAGLCPVNVGAVVSAAVPVVKDQT